MSVVFISEINILYSPHVKIYSKILPDSVVKRLKDHPNPTILLSEPQSFGYSPVSCPSLLKF